MKKKACNRSHSTVYSPGVTVDIETGRCIPGKIFRPCSGKFFGKRYTCSRKIHAQGHWFSLQESLWNNFDLLWKIIGF